MMDTATQWHHWPQVWYVVARSDQLLRGQVIDGHLAGRSWVVYRGERGQVYAMGAFCPHMGAHLRSAKVVGEALLCGLHACLIGVGEKTDRAQQSCRQAALAWPCIEHSGLVWLHLPVQSLPAVPFENTASNHHWLGAGPLSIEADWRAMICNGFDLAHMKVVHQRSIVGQPEFVRTQEGALQMTYRTKVLARGGLSSWVMQKLSGGVIELVHTCCGSSIRVQSRVGRFRTTAIFALLPQQMPNIPPHQRSVRAFAAIGVPQGVRLPRVQLWLARILYLAFLKKDFVVVQNMNLKLDDVDDPGVAAVAQYQAQLSAIGEAYD